MLIRAFVHHWIIKVTFCLSLPFCAMAILAEEYAFYVTDRKGTPLKDAAIMLPGGQLDSTESLAIMDQVEVSFSPRLLVIQKGQQVSFPNSDNIRHHVYSFSSAKNFEIKLYTGTPESPILFDEAGIVVLGCNIHDSMVGYIVVSDSSLAGSTNEKGVLRISTDSKVDSLRIWHPLLASVSADIVPLTLSLPAANKEHQRVIELDVELQSEAIEPPVTFKSRYRKSR